MSSKQRRERAQMETQTAQNDAPATNNESEQALQATQESLDKVRDILFGNQLRQQDSRFSQLEEKVSSQLGAFREETRKSLETLQEFVKSELNAALGALAAESQQRHDSFKRLQEELGAADHSLSERLEQATRSLGDESKAGLQAVAQDLQNKSGALESRIAATEQHQQQAASELRAQLLEATNRLRDEGNAVKAELHALVEKLVNDLRSAKTDRTALATLFNEMAGRLQA